MCIRDRPYVVLDKDGIRIGFVGVDLGVLVSALPEILGENLLGDVYKRQVSHKVFPLWKKRKL